MNKRLKLNVVYQAKLGDKIIQDETCYKTKDGLEVQADFDSDDPEDDYGWVSFFIQQGPGLKTPWLKTIYFDKELEKEDIDFIKELKECQK